MLVSAAGLAAMTTLQVHTPYWQSALWLAMVGVGSGMFNSPNTAAMMGVVPAHRRGIAAGARTLLQNTGAVLSIAFVLAIVTSAIPKATLFAIFSGLAKGLSAGEARAVHRQHAHRPVGARGDLAARHVRVPAAPAPRTAGRGRARRRARRIGDRATANELPAGRVHRVSLRIGDVARLVGTTPRTIRYYEEIGLLPEAPARPAGQHRLYSDEEVERLREVMRLKHLLGVSLEELKTLLTRRGGARRGARAARSATTSTPSAGASCWSEALGHIDRQLELVRHRAGELAKLEHELCETRKRVQRKLRELEPRSAPSSARERRGE